MRMKMIMMNEKPARVLILPSWQCQQPAGSSSQWATEAAVHTTQDDTPITQSVMVLISFAVGIDQRNYLDKWGGMLCIAR